MTTTADITVLLNQSQQGNSKAWEQLLEYVYPSLRQIVANRLKSNKDYVTVDTTELAHEVYLKLDKQRSFSWQNRNHFFSIIARVSRRVVIDYIRTKSCAKRGAEFKFIPIEEGSHDIAQNDFELWLTISKLLDQLNCVDPQIVELTELRFFAGFSLEEISEIKETSLSTIKRQWRFAQSWLSQQLENEHDHA